jgi:hypothetical protein
VQMRTAAMSGERRQLYPSTSPDNVATTVT